MVVEYDELLKNPSGTYQGVLEHLGEDGDPEAATSTVRQDLKRSYPENKPSAQWPDAELVYDALLRKDWDAIIDFANTPNTETVKAERGFLCARAGTQVVAAHCETCHGNEDFMRSMRKMAEQKHIQWNTFPCAWEVAYGPDSIRKTIDQSIEENHWWTERDTKKAAWEEHKKAVLKSREENNARLEAKKGTPFHKVK